MANAAPSPAITGTLVAIFDDQQVTEKFRKREFVIQTADQYPQTIKLQLSQDKCDLIDPYAVGEEVEVSYNLRGRSYEKAGQTLYFNTIEAWKIQRVGGAAPARATATRPAAAPIASDDDNDLPF